MCIHICVVGCLHTFLCACVCMYVYVCLIVSVCEYLFTCIFICLCIDENQLRTKRKQDLKCISTRTWLYQLKGMSWVSALKNNDLMVQHMITNIHENIYSTYQWKTLRISDHLRRQWTQNCKLDEHLVKKKNFLKTFAATTLRISEHFRRLRSRKYCLREHRIRKHSG